MPAIGIEPIREYKSRRILSPVRLPIPPLRHKLAPRVGLEPTAYRLTAGCSTIELSRNTYVAVRLADDKDYYTISISDLSTYNSFFLEKIYEKLLFLSARSFSWLARTMSIFCAYFSAFSSSPKERYISTSSFMESTLLGDSFSTSRR